MTAKRPKPASVAPKPDPKPQIPHPEDWAAWCEHPVTRFVASAFLKGAELQRDAWTATSWGDGKALPVTLAELRARADAYMAFLETGLEQHVQTLEA